MTGNQFQAVLKAFEKRSENTDLRRDRYHSASTYEANFRSHDFYGVEGRTNEEAVQQVVDNIKALAKELEEIGV